MGELGNIIGWNPYTHPGAPAMHKPEQRCKRDM